MADMKKKNAILLCSCQSSKKKIRRSKKPLGKGRGKERKKKVYMLPKGNRYNHSGDDGKEVPPVPIPNTEVKLFYAESTCRELPGGQVIAAFQTEPCSILSKVLLFCIMDIISV